MQTDNQPSNTGKASRNVNQAVDKASSATHDKIERAQSAARPAVDNLAQGAHETVDRIAESASNAAHKIDQKHAEFREVQEEAMDQLRAYVNEHPVAALSMAVAGGFLLSRILSSR